MHSRLSSAAIRSDGGAGSILVVSIVATMFAFVVILVPVGAVLIAREKAAGAADAAALAAADIAIGLRPGDPCTAASAVADANGTALAACSVDGATVTVQVRVRAGGFTVDRAATAGPPSDSMREG